MITDNIEMLRFNSDNELQYKEFLNSIDLPEEFYVLSLQDFKSNNNIFVWVKREKLLFSIHRIIPFGYCIVNEIDKMPTEFIQYSSVILHINSDTLSRAPTVIADFMINKKYRRRELGTQFANQIVNDIYGDKNLSLHADGDGLYFWNKIGFDFVQGSEPDMVLMRK